MVGRQLRGLVHHLHSHRQRQKAKGGPQPGEHTGGSNAGGRLAERRRVGSLSGVLDLPFSTLGNILGCGAVIELEQRRTTFHRGLRPGAEFLMIRLRLSCSPGRTCSFNPTPRVRRFRPERDG